MPAMKHERRKTNKVETRRYYLVVERVSAKQRHLSFPRVTGWADRRLTI